jgi:hypothetical protein
MSPRIQPLTPERAQVLITDPARKRLLDQIACASTREQIDAAWQAQRAWLTANPDDIGVLEAGEDLAHATSALDGEIARHDEGGIVAFTRPGSSAPPPR